jgi:periplasmic copper chaperone A
VTAPSPRRGLAGLLLALALSPGVVQGELRLVDGWIAEPPPGSRILAGYLTLENTGAESRSLVKVSSPRFAQVEMHRTVVVEGLARMEVLASLVIPAGGRLTMQPGGDHLMLIDPAAPIAIGAQVEVHVEFDDRSARVLMVEVRPRLGEGTGEHLHHPESGSLGNRIVSMAGPLPGCVPP